MQNYLECQFCVWWNLTWFSPELKNIWKVIGSDKIFRFLNIGHLHLSFYSWIKTRHQSVYTPCDIFRYYFSTFPWHCLGDFWPMVETESAIYWWEKLFWENFWSKIFCQSWNWLDFHFHFDFLPAWLFVSMIIMINHHIVLHHAKHGPMIIDSDIPLRPSRTCFPDKIYPDMIDLLIPVLTRDNVLSSYKKHLIG